MRGEGGRKVRAGRQGGRRAGRAGGREGAFWHFCFGNIHPLIVIYSGVNEGA